MKRVLMLLGCIVLAGGARAEETAAPPQCSLVSGLIVAQDQGTVTISCSGVTADYGEQLSALLSQILKDHLDPQSVVAKLDEIERAPEAGKARMVDENQRQAIVQALVGKPAEDVAILAHSGVDDSADYGKAIATPLLMVGWQIQGHQIKRSVPRQLDEVRGVALLVRNKDKAPAKAVVLRTALAAAHIVAPILADPSVPEGSVTIWIGRPPVFLSAEQKP
ncbi:MAG: hypothetical protein JO267_00600 [Alphaproteobacteria bacterium]|nr:hypothetical protein [Alphaproteobacteria bacterium]